MQFNVHSLVFKQCCWIMLGVAVVFGVIFFVLRNQTGNCFSDILIREGQEVSEKNVALIDRVFAESARIGELTVSRLEQENPNEAALPKTLAQLLEMARNGRPEIMAIVVAYEPESSNPGAGKMFLAHWTDNKIKVIQGGDYQNKPWYSDVKKQRRALWCEPFIGDFIKEPIAIYTLPLYETNSRGIRRFAGVVCVDISLAFLQQTISKIPISNSGYAFLLSKSARIVAHPRQDWVFRESLLSLAQQEGQSDIQKFFDQIQEGKNGLFQGHTFAGTQACIYYTPMKSNDWTFGIVFPSEEFFAQQKNFDYTFLIIGGVGFIIMLLVVFLVSVRVSRPLKNLAKLAGEIGQGNFDVAIPVIRSHDEIGMFAAAFNLMRLSLSRHIEDLKNVTAAKEKIESELKVAQGIQKGILPKILPPFPKCDFFEVDAFLTPAREVGGDLYDFFLLSPTKVCLVIGDVSGKGVPASLFMAVTQTLHRGLAHEAQVDPQILVTKMNQALCNNNSANLFVTYIFAVLDLLTGVMTYSNAGHNPFFILKEDGQVCSPAQRHGIPLGVRLNRTYGQSELQLDMGDTLFFYTDGVTEARNAQGEFFGEARLKNFLQQAAQKQLSPKEIDLKLQAVLAEFVGEEEPFDDVTTVCLKVLKRNENPGNIKL